MLVFSTRFPLKDDISVEECVALFSEWAIGSPHYGIEKIDYDVRSDNDFDLVKDQVRVSIRKYTSDQVSLVACRLENADVAATFRFDCIMMNEAGEKSVLIQLNSIRTNYDLRVPRAKKPYIVRSFIEKGYCKDDNEIPVVDYALKAENYLDACVGIMNGVSGNSMPVVYVSCDYWNKPMVDTCYLAQQLGGVAHVMVETRHETSLRLRDRTGGNNVHTGYVGIYIPGTKFCIKYTADDYSDPKKMVREIISAVWNVQINRLDSSVYNWNQIITLQSRQKMMEWKDISGDKEKELQSYMENFDAELAGLRHQIDELNRQLGSAESQRDVYKAMASEKDKTCFYRPGREPCLYPTERSDLLYSILSKVKNRYPKDSRGYVLIESMLEANPRAGDCAKIVSGVHAVFDDGGRLNSAKKSQLKDLGFTITEDGKHYKITFQDPRYMFTTSKTPSEHRGGRNLSSEICKVLDVEKKV